MAGVLELANVGVTCWINATLQAFTQIDRFWPEVDSYPAEDRSLSRLLSALQSVKWSDEGYQVLFPHGVLARYVYAAVPHLNQPGMQQDAHEFAVFVIDALDDARFKGHTVSRVTCQRCEGVSDRPEHFTQLTVMSLRAMGDASMMDHILRQFSDRSLEGYHCEACCAESGDEKLRTDAVIRQTIDAWPDVLMLHVARFDPVRHTKDMTPFNFSTRWRKEKDRVRYRLRAMVLHLGQNIHAGHYVCIGRVGDSDWRRYDDARTRSVMLADVCSQWCRQNVYLLFYERVPWEAP